MIEIRHRLFSVYSAEILYELVNDVEAYPFFLPWCRSVIIQEQGERYKQAEIEIVYSGLRKTFITRNTLWPTKQIDITWVKGGAFQYLAGQWQFTALANEGCQVDFNLQFAFRSKWVGRLIYPLAQHLSHKLTQAFIDRAEQLFGKKVCK